MKRRDLLRAAAVGAAMARVRGGPAHGDASVAVAVVADPSDPVAGAPAARRALEELARRLADAGAVVRRLERVGEASAGELCVVACGPGRSPASAALRRSGAAPAASPESLALAEASVSGRRAVVACGADARGLAYALLELCDRLQPGVPVPAALSVARPIVERPARRVRSVMRQFTCETLDKPWFYDRTMWPRYLAMLATHRFNRLHLAFGLGYDSLRRVADSYLLFAYPFLVSVPGYPVRVTNLPDGERERNLETLRFIGEAAVARGLDFQLGIWMHGYRLDDSPEARYVVEGLTPETHAAYCRDALTAVLRACPAISSVALRIHGESGIAEGSYDFWSTVFAGVARCGRAVEIDLHAKGLDTTMIGRARATGMPVNVSPKYAAEHLGMPYHQAAIREREMPVPGKSGRGLMTLSEGSRVFTRYGYADFLREDRTFTVRPRVFSGTQRVLAWGDPAWAAAYGRAFGFCGMVGVDLMEPLTCRGRRGTGVGTRIGYADAALAPRWDWQKYGAWYRAWGRMTYDPASPADVFDRELGAHPRRRVLGAALVHASRILPIVTTAYLPSAACDAYWPEIYWNQPMVSAPTPDPYFDTVSPATFQHASPLDPQLFSSAAEHAAELLGGPRSGRYSPIEVAQWLEDLAGAAEADLARAGAPVAPDGRRIAIDAAMLAELGRFFAAKLRAGVLYAIHERSGDSRALEGAVATYRRARAAWADAAGRARGVYQADLSASDRFDERGQWADRLAGIDRDIAQMARRMAAALPSDDRRVAAAVAEAQARPRRPAIRCDHAPPAAFQPKAALRLNLTVKSAPGSVRARLHYRRVDQAERWEALPMRPGDGAFTARIPAAYTDSPYPLQYYFEVAIEGGVALYPGLGPGLSGQPYFVLRSA